MECDTGIHDLYLLNEFQSQQILDILYNDALCYHHAIEQHDAIKQKRNPTKYLLHLLSAVV
jgi:hypothetical protein